MGEHVERALSGHARVELRVLDKVACTDADSQVMGALSIDTSGGESSFVNGIIG